MMRTKLWVDDLRPPPDAELRHGSPASSTWIWAKTSAGAIDILSGNDPVHTARITEMSLDHDLGGDDTTRPVVLWMCENDVWPDKITAHTANPVGREWLEGMIARYARTL